MTTTRLLPPGKAPERREGDLLRRDPTLLAAVLASAAAPILVLDRSGRIVVFNRACEVLTGHSGDEARGRPLWDLLLAGEEAAAWKAAFGPIRTPLPARQELTWRTRDGGTRRVSCSTSPVDRGTAGAPYTLMIGADVTELRSLEQKVIEAGEHERRRLGRDLHDSLGQDLTGLILVSRALQIRLGSRSPAADDAARLGEIAQRAIRTAAALARGNFFAGLSVEELPERLDKMADFVLRCFGVRCDVEWDPGLAIPGEAGPAHVYWIVQEAVTNAVRHGCASRIRVRAGREGGRVRVEIRDDGRGIEAFRASSGIGVQIMSSRARALGAMLQISNHPEGGVQVECLLPPSEEPAG